MKPVVWMFSGQGSQYFQMGRDLYEGEPLFRRTLDDCSEILRPLLGESLTEQIYRQRPDRFAPFDRTRFSNPAIVALQVGVARVLRARGQAPDLVLGYSLGEVAAGIVAGALTLEDGLRLAVGLAEVLERSASPGAMLAVLAEPALVERQPDWFAGTWVAAENFSGHFVVSGEPAAIAKLETRLLAEKMTVQRLPVEYAFHSPLIEPIGEGVRGLVASLNTSRAGLDMISASGGAPYRNITEAALWETIRQPVPFARTIAALEEQGPYRYVDLGPSGTLGTFVKYALADGSSSEIAATVTPYGNALTNLDRLLPARQA